MAEEIKRLTERLKSKHAEWEENTMCGGYKVSALRKAFERVQDRTHWKNPILAYVRVEDREITAAAIMFYTATVATFEPAMVAQGWLLVEAAGYRNGPAGP